MRVTIMPIIAWLPLNAQHLAMRQPCGPTPIRAALGALAQWLGTWSERDFLGLRTVSKGRKWGGGGGDTSTGLVEPAMSCGNGSIFGLGCHGQLAMA